MIQHIVIYRFKNPSPKLFETIKDKFSTIRGNVEGLLRLDVGEDIMHLPRSYDLALYCEFSDRAAYDRYQGCDLHLAVKAFMKTVVSESHSVDFEN